MTSRSRARLAIALFASLGGERSALGAGELEGQIRGRVIEAATEVPVPGATVTVTSPGLGDARIVTTDENGEYLVPNLPIGVYTVTVGYSGVKPMTRQTLVQPGTTTPLNFRWSAELAEAETTTVVEERHLTNPDSTQTGTVVSIDQYRYIPTNRTYTDSVRMAPGVTRNVTSVDHYVKGGRSYHNRYLIDGLDVTDPNTRQAQQQLAFESVEAVQVITGGFDAEYNTFGGIINTLTREGSDEWRATATVFGTHNLLRARGNWGNTIYERERDFDLTDPPTTYSYTATASVGGPIIKHKLWFNTTFQYNYSFNGRTIGGALNLPHVAGINQTYLPRLKISWAPSLKQRIGLSLAADPEVQSNTSGSGNRLSAYETHTNKGGFNAVVNWSVFPNPNFEFRIDAGLRALFERSGPEGYFAKVDTRYCDQFSSLNCTYDREAQAHVNETDGSVWYNANTDFTRNDRYTFQVDPKVTLRGRFLGEHAAKVGVQFRYFVNYNSYHEPGGFTYSDRGGFPLEEGLCQPEYGKTTGCFQRVHRDDRSFYLRGNNAALFFQDNWRVLSWLRLAPGIRFDYGQVRNPDGTTFLSQFAVGPRMGLIIDLTGDQKTILSTSYGRANEFPYLGFARDYLAGSLGEGYTEQWRNGVWELQARTSGAGTRSVDPKARTPYADAVTTSIRREIYRNTVVSLEHTWKRIASTWDSIEQNVIWDRTGYRVLDYVDESRHESLLYTTSADNVRTYHGFILSVDGRPTPHWYFVAAYTLSWLYGTGWNNPGTAHRIPQMWKFENGWQTEDQRHQVHAAASYNLPFGLTLGARLEYVSGQPLNKFFIVPGLPDNQTTGRRSPRGTTPGNCSGNITGQGSFNPASTACGNDVSRIADYRVPQRVNLDLQMAYNLYPLLRQHIELMGYVYNLFNDNGAVTLNENDANSGTFGQVNTRNGTISFRIGARYDF